MEYVLALSDKVTKRFWSHVDMRGPDECWPWKKARDKKGYGRVNIRGADGKRHYPRAHRVAWMLTHNQPLPPLVNVLHTCDHPWCQNDKHHFLGTDDDNMRDMVLKRRAATGKRNGMHTQPTRRATGNRNGSRRHPERLVRGAKHPAAKLRDVDVLQILEWYRLGVFDQYEIATAKGINQSTVNAIVSGRTWKTITHGVPTKPMKANEK